MLTRFDLKGTLTKRVGADYVAFIFVILPHGSLFELRLELDCVSQKLARLFLSGG